MRRPPPPHGRRCEQTITRSNGNQVEQWSYSYTTISVYGLTQPPQPQYAIQSVALSRSADGGQTFNPVQSVVNAYYDGTTSGGESGFLKSATVKDANQNVIDVSAYRYYVPGDTGGAVPDLKMDFSPQSYALAVAAGYDPTSASDAQVQQFATHYFKYTTDGTNRVSWEAAQAAGCSCPSASGEGTYSYTYAASGFYSTSAPSYNVWQERTTTALPNGNQEVVYTNGYGEPMLDINQQLGAATGITSIATGDGTDIYKVYSSGAFSQGDVVVIQGVTGVNNWAIGDNGTYKVLSTGSDVNGNYVELADGRGSGADAGGTIQKLVQQSATYFRYYDLNLNNPSDPNVGHLVLDADPSAVAIPLDLTATENAGPTPGLDYGTPDLVGFSTTTGLAAYLNNTGGLIANYSYYFSDHTIGWNFSGPAGITANNSAVSGTVAAESGHQAGFILQGGSMSQTLSFGTTGNYTFSFDAAQRANVSGSNESLQVMLDGVAVGAPFTPGTGYSGNGGVTLNITSTGQHVISIVGVPGSIANSGALIENAALSAGAPTLGNANFEAPDLAAGVWVYDPGSDMATSSDPGAAGYTHDVFFQNGTLGAGQPQDTRTYGEHTITGSPYSVYPLASDTVYSGADGAGAQTTTLGYPAWYSGTFQPQIMTITDPTVTAGQNGPGTATTEREFLDQYGRVIWSMDADNYVDYTAYDNATGAITQTITDVDYSKLTTAEQTSFNQTGWPHPTGGLHLTTTTIPDNLGRPHEVTDPNNNSIVYTYNDANHEVRIYPGWNSATNSTTGPVEISREYRPAGIVLGQATAAGTATTLIDTNLSPSGSYVGLLLSITGGTDNGQSDAVTAYDPATGTLTLARPLQNATGSSTTFVLGSGYNETMTEAPPSGTPIHLGSDGLPDGTESIGTVYSLSRQLTNNSNQIVEQDDYFSLAGVTYSASQTYLGVVSNNTAAGNFHATYFWYDERGDLARTLEPTGTIDRTVYDLFREPVSQWVGTNDTPASGWWSPTNNGGTSNMMNVKDDVYDDTGAAAAPAVSATPGGSAAETVYYVSITWVTSSNGVASESPGSLPVMMDVASSNLLVVTPPAAAPAGAVGYNVYVSTEPGMEQLQNAAPIAPAAAWTQPAGGVLASGRLVNLSGSGDGNLTAIIQHPGPAKNFDGTINPERITRDVYDWRNRKIAEKDGAQAIEDNTTNRPVYVWTLDNLGEATAAYQLDGDGIPVSDLGNGFAGLTADEQAKLATDVFTSFDDVGQIYQQAVGGEVNGVFSAGLTTNFFHDFNGNLLEESDPGGQVAKHQFDAANRDVKDSVTDGQMVNFHNLSPTDAADGTDANDVVVEQVLNTYDKNSNLIETEDRQRFDTDPATATGDLAGPGGGNLASRDYFKANYFDAANRQAASVDVGTNEGTAWVMPAAAPARSDTVLVTSTGYLADTVQTVTVGAGAASGSFQLTFDGSDPSYTIPAGAVASLVQSDLEALSTIGAGNVSVTGPQGGPYLVRFIGTLAGTNQPLLVVVNNTVQDQNHASVPVTGVTSMPGGDSGLAQSTVDPRGIASYNDLDMLGRTVNSIAAFTNGVPTNSTDQTVSDTFDGNDDVLTTTAVQPAGGSTPNQTTAYVLGVGGTIGTHVFSNDLIQKVEYPDVTTGQPGTIASEQETFDFNLLGEETAYTDRDGTTHKYLRDVLGRLTADVATAVPDHNVVSLILRLGYSFDPAGLPFKQTSYSDVSGLSVANQVQDAYNGYGQLTTQYQAHSGAVVVGTTPEVQYQYAQPAGANYSRLAAMIYPNGKQLDYNYTTTLDSAISRVDQLADPSGMYAGNDQSYLYLGLNTIVQETDGNGVALSYIKQPNDTHAIADGGDKYTGLDRFGRVSDQNWVDLSTGVSTDRFQYGYDRDSNVLYKNNLVNSSFSELYHANSTAAGDNNSAYDPLNRLKAFTRGTLSASPNNGGVLDTVATANTLAGSSQTWTLDAQGNMINSTANGATSFNAENQIKPWGYTNGNLASGPSIGGARYDAWNRDVGGGISSFDALNRKIVDALSGQDLYSDAAGNVIQGQQGSTVVDQYVWGLGHPNNLVLANANFGYGYLDRLYQQQDAIGNVTAEVANGAFVSQRYTYDPYGTATVLLANWQTSGTNFNVYYGFQGGRTDLSGMVHFGGGLGGGGYGRDYDPYWGVWLQPEPYGAAYIDGMNLYQAMGGNPVNSVDPTGTTAMPIIRGLVEAGEVTGEVAAKDLLRAAAGTVIVVGYGGSMAIDTGSWVYSKYEYHQFHKPANPLSGRPMPANVTGGDSGRPNSATVHHQANGAPGETSGEGQVCENPNAKGAGGDAGSTANKAAPKAADVKSPADLPDYAQWPSKPADSGKGTVYTDPGNPGRQVREMDPVTHEGADPAKRSPRGYVRYSDGYGGKTPPMPR